MTAQAPTLLCSIDETAALLGLGRRTVYTLMHGGKLPPSHKIGGKRVFVRADIERWVELGMPSLERFMTLTGKKR